MGKPFFSFPLDDLKPRLRIIATALRTLSDEQLNEEIVQLEALSHAAKDQIATRSMLSIYRAEARRRKSPEHQFDTDLGAALSRLERATTEPDRRMVRQIGERLHQVGGIAATRRAFERMTTDCSKRVAELRARILDNRWAGLLG